MYPHPELVMAQARAHLADMTSHARAAPASAPSRPALRQPLGWLLVELGLRLAMSENPSPRRVARRGVARRGALRRGVRRRYAAGQIAAP